MQGKESRKYAEEDYKKVIYLRKIGWSQGKIAEEIGVSSATVWHWVNTSRKPRSLYAKRQTKPFPKRATKLSSELAYIYGVLIGDASIENTPRTSRINLNVTDEDFAQEFARALKRWCDIKPTINERIQKHNHQTKYGDWIRVTSHLHVVRLGSKRAVNFLLNKIKCKTYDWEVPKEITNCENEEIIYNFIKGLFDSEGYPIHYRRWKRIELEIFGQKGVFQVQALLKKINIDCTITQGRKQKIKGTYLIRILRKKSIKCFADKIGFTIRRKRDKLKAILNSYK